MKNPVFFLILTLSFPLTTVLSAVHPSNFQAAPLSDSLPEAYRALLPDGYEVPARLPATIKDPLLLTAWVYIFNQQEMFAIHDDIQISGRGLAELVYAVRIPVSWGSEKNCRGFSCAKRTLCTDQECVRKFQRKDGDVIYIDQELREPTKKALPQLVMTLAHELYHQTLPFGPVGTSLFEEYWAYYVGTQVSKAGWMEFKGYDPLKAACLKRWFVVYGLDRYSGIGPYPFTLQTEVDLVNETCIPE